MKNSSASFPRRNWKVVGPDCDWNTMDRPALPIREQPFRSGDHIPCRCIRISAYAKNQGTEDRVQGTGESGLDAAGSIELFRKLTEDFAKFVEASFSFQPFRASYSAFRKASAAPCFVGKRDGVVRSFE